MRKTICDFCKSDIDHARDGYLKFRSEVHEDVPAAFQFQMKIPTAELILEDGLSNDEEYDICKDCFVGIIEGTQ